MNVAIKMMSKYSKLQIAKYELNQYLDSVGEHHPTRSFIERAIGDIDKVMKYAEDI